MYATLLLRRRFEEHVAGHGLDNVPRAERTGGSPPSSGSEVDLARRAYERFQRLALWSGDFDVIEVEQIAEALDER